MLCDVFGKAPPVYSKPTEQPPARSAHQPAPSTGADHRPRSANQQTPSTGADYPPRATQQQPAQGGLKNDCKVISMQLTTTRKKIRVPDGNLSPQLLREPN